MGWGQGAVEQGSRCKCMGGLRVLPGGLWGTLCCHGQLERRERVWGMLKLPSACGGMELNPSRCCMPEAGLEELIREAPAGLLLPQQSLFACTEQDVCPGTEGAPVEAAGQLGGGLRWHSGAARGWGHSPSKGTSLLLSTARCIPFPSSLCCHRVRWLGAAFTSLVLVRMRQKPSGHPLVSPCGSLSPPAVLSWRLTSERRWDAHPKRSIFV